MYSVRVSFGAQEEYRMVSIPIHQEEYRMVSIPIHQEERCMVSIPLHQEEYRMVPIPIHTSWVSIYAYRTDTYRDYSDTVATIRPFCMVT